MTTEADTRGIADAILDGTPIDWRSIGTEPLGKAFVEPLVLATPWTTGTRRAMRPVRQDLSPFAGTRACAAE